MLVLIPDRLDIGCMAKGAVAVGLLWVGCQVVRLPRRDGGDTRLKNCRCRQFLEEG